MLPRTCMILTFVALASTACTTVETWDRGLPKAAHELETDDAKKAEYRRYVIRDVGVKHGKGYFEVQGETDEDVHLYSASSFYPVLEQVSPSVKSAVEEIAEAGRNDDWTDAAQGAGAAAMIFGPTSWIRQFGTGALVAGMGGRIILDNLHKNQLEKVMTRYNADLTQRIYVLKPDEPTI